MPVSSETSVNGPYYPNGVTTDFSFDFKATAANEVVAVDQDGTLISTALYSVTLDSDEGGTLSFGTAPELADYSEIYVVSDPELTQPSDFDNTGPSYNPAALTRAFDRAAARDLKIKREVDRGFKAPFGETGQTLPVAASRANQFLSFGPDGSLVMSSGTGADLGLRADVGSTDPGKGAALVALPQGATAAQARASKVAVPDQSGIAAMASALDSDLLRSGYIPTWNEDVEISSTITIEQPGTRIYGDGGPTYDRGNGKVGWLTGAIGLTRMFDLGNSRAAGVNNADTWEIDHLSLKPSDMVNDLREIDGIAFTSRTNGPDRGIRITSNSFVGLKDAITIENTDISVTSGTMSIEGNVFTRNASAVHAKGRVFGFRFVGNECEQNAGGTDGNGVIRGCFDGPVTIDGNMLEGQPNAISLDIFAMTGTSPTFSSKGNYFEANTGDYVYRFRANAPWVCEIGPNYTQAITATDYLLVKGCSSYGKLILRDNFPVMFDNSPCTLAYGSEILCRQQRSYNIRTISSTKATEVVISNWMGLTDDDADHTHVWAPSPYAAVPTPYGSRRAAPAGSFITVPLAVAVGDLVSINMLMRAEEVVAGNLSFQAYDSTGTNIVRQWGSSNVAKVLAGKWALVNVALVANFASSSIRVRFNASSGTYDVAVAAVAAKNMGAYANDGVATAAIKPVAPTPETTPGFLSGSHAYGGITLADGAGANVIATLTGAVLGDYVTALSYSQNLQNLTVTAAVRAADSIGIRIQNETGAEVILAAGTFYYEGKKR